MSGYVDDSIINWGEDSEFVPCPYDRSHIVPRSRIPYHLVKCSSHHKDVDLDTCPYNASHRIPKEKVLDHLGNCPDKHKIELLCPSEFVQPGKTGCIPHSDFVQSRFEMVMSRSHLKSLENDSSDTDDESTSSGDSGDHFMTVLTGRKLHRRVVTLWSGKDTQYIMGYMSSVPDGRHHPRLRPPHSLPEALKCLEVKRE